MVTPHTRWLITGFEPFGPHAYNPSPDVARACAAALAADGCEVEAHELPVTFACASRWASSHASPGEDAFIVHVGLAGQRAHTSLEVVARDHIGTTPDNEGEAPAVLAEGGPPRRTTQLDVGALREVLSEASSSRDLPGVELSEDAGDYVCNAIYYHSLANAPREGAALFVHVPPLSPAGAQALGEALGEALATLARRRGDAGA